LGAVGMPWFAGGRYGPDVVLGYTGGYLIGFIAAAWLIGYVSEEKRWAVTWRGQFSLMMSGAMLILAVGTLGLSLSMGVPLSVAFIWGFLPFAAVETAKAVCAGLSAPLFSEGLGEARKAG
ncbi:MAG: biotin transporter BioY, partial [Thermoplasmata archaeon]|nr:biotin transporter BioY [Thermoplasmata archaeon]